MSAVADGVRVRLRVQPRARTNRVHGLGADADGGAAVKLTVTAAPEDGKANAAVIELLAREWGLAKSAMKIVLGAADRRKVIQVAGRPTELMARLTDWIEGLETRK
ncbi:MAG: DUF167 domain-containing protein [Dongiaceae bacterium]